jgi:hypothetical protein
MKPLIFVLCLTAFVSPVLRAQSLTPEDRDKGLQYLEKTRAGVIEATKGLSEAQWNFKPATNRWSVAEVTEHIAAAESFMMGMVQEQVMKAPPRPAGEDVKAIDEFVLKNIPDRTTKRQAPEPLKPENRFGSPKASLAHFEESRAKTIEFLKSTPCTR